VQAGDTLGVIAANFGTTVDELLAVNGLSDPNYLYVGQQLVIPGAAVAQQAQAVAAVQPVSNTTSGGGQVHTVQSGDTLFAIAGQYGSSVDAIMGVNGLADPDYLFVGQQLSIP
jgi:LysM repeat protein